jgi:hypothetical protein
MSNSTRSLLIAERRLEDLLESAPDAIYQLIAKPIGLKSLRSEIKRLLQPAAAI